MRTLNHWNGNRMSNGTENTNIAVIRTDRFNIAMMGRSGSRSFMMDLARKINHSEIFTEISSFNRKDLLLKQRQNARSFIPHILVLRNPIERAKSGSSLNLPLDYHGYPFLHCIDFDIVTHIIKFEQIGRYVKTHVGRAEDALRGVWDISDIPDEIMKREMELYEKFLTKPIYNYEDYKIGKQNLQYINFRGVKGIRYKKWDS